MKTFRGEPKAINDLCFLFLVSWYLKLLLQSGVRKHLSGLFDLFSFLISEPSSGLKSDVLMDAGKLSFENCHIESSACILYFFVVCPSENVLKCSVQIIKTF